MSVIRLVVVLSVLSTLSGCQTKPPTQGSSQNHVDGMVVNRVLAAYLQYFPEARPVRPPASAPEYFSGIYRDHMPGGGALSGWNLYLFPDATFILTEWGDIMRERVLTRGDWRYVQGCVRFMVSTPPDAPVDLTYVPFRFRDSDRDVLVLMGTPNGYRHFTSWLAKHEPDIRKARSQYDADVRVRRDFRFTTQAEEMLYVSFFAGTYAQEEAFDTRDWKATKNQLLLRTQELGK